MVFLLALFGISLLVWSAAYARRGSLLVATTAILVGSYVFPYHFWHASLGPLPLTVDRLLFAGLLAMLFWHWRQGRLATSSWLWCDSLVVALIAYLTVRCYFTPPPGVVRAHVGPWWRLVASFWMPAILYAAVRLAPLNQKVWRAAMLIFTALGVYLSLTAFGEVTQQWWAVFPKYIADPTLGAHFGRARGPALMSASLGVYLTVCFWAAWMLAAEASRLGRIAIVACMLVSPVAIYFTYTRSTWLGLAGGLAIVPMLQMPRRLRIPVMLAGGFALSLGLVLYGGELTKLGRKDSNGSAEHSVYQRASFAYVSWEMFKDAPVVGHGLGRFYDLKTPYLADRSQQIELESIRDLDHHNTFLSVLVETGATGLVLLLSLLAAWTHIAWKVWRDAAAARWIRLQGLFSLAVMVAYLATALFHDLTLSPTEQWLLFLTSGVTVGIFARQQQPVLATETVPVGQLSVDLPRRRDPIATPLATVPQLVELFGMKINPLNMSQTVAEVLSWCASSEQAGCRYVVTPNVDHAVMFQVNSQLQAAYCDASLVLADGAPVVLASRLLQRGVPERVAGSDLVPALFQRASQTPQGRSRPQRRLRVFLLGAAPGVAERARTNIHCRWPGVEVVGIYAPPLGFEKNTLENERILRQIAAANADLLVVGLGAPKQELWVHQHAKRIQAKAALCVGATIDFLAGEKQRAPRWMQSLGLEWLHRVASEPKRLAKRYLRDGWVFPQLVWREWRKI